MALVVFLSDLQEVVTSRARAMFVKGDACPGIRELVNEPSLSPIA